MATGVYTPGTSTSDSFALVPGVAVYGGFAGTETARSQRDWANNVTVFSGDIDNNDTGKDADQVVTDPDNIVGSNSIHVVVADGTTGTAITETTRLDGFTITAGYANGSGADGFGGGLYCDAYRSDSSGSVCSPTLTNLRFIGNAADKGGAIYNDGYNQGESSPSLVNVVFVNNQAYDGGAMYNDGANSGTSSPYLVNVSVVGNSADSDGGAHIQLQ